MAYFHDNWLYSKSSIWSKMMMSFQKAAFSAFNKRRRNMSRQKWFVFLFLLIFSIAPLLTSCAQPTAQETAATTEQAPAVTEAAPESTEAGPAATEAVPVETEATEGSHVGGILITPISAEPSTLDPTLADNSGILDVIGATLIARDPQTGEFVPWLADSWEISADGTVITFTLKDGILFQDGTPMTAEDYAFTLMRAIDPNMASPVAGPSLIGMVSAVATDDKTLVITLAQPNFSIFSSLATLNGFMMPLSKAYVESHNEEFIARNPMSVGPYIFKEWLTGEKIVLDRNPNYTWGPAYAPGPANIQTIEYRIIADQATEVAAMEAGELTMAAIPNSEISRFQDATKYTLYHTMDTIEYPVLSFNLAKAPFDDLRVRQALNYAVNRQGIIDVILGGDGVPAYGPVSPSMGGYWPGVEQIGYNYDKEKALALFAEAGYTPGADGMLQKDGQPFAFTLISPPYDFVTPVLEILKEQYKDVGIDMTIEQVDPAILQERGASGDYEVEVSGYSYPDADVLFYFFHSSNLGGMNHFQVADPTLDAMLDQSRATMDPTARQEIVDNIQKYIVENAYWVPIANAYGYFAVSTALKGTYWSDVLSRLILDSAYFEQ
jgi:peptide/nickel transport system substrate-binding protein